MRRRPAPHRPTTKTGVEPRKKTPEDRQGAAYPSTDEVVFLNNWLTIKYVFLTFHWPGAPPVAAATRAGIRPSPRDVLKVSAECRRDRGGEAVGRADRRRLRNC